MEITVAHVIGFISAIAVFWGGAIVGVYLNENKAARLRYEAVKNGFATWQVDNNGNTKFEWNEKKVINTESSFIESLPE